MPALPLFDTSEGGSDPRDLEYLTPLDVLAIHVAEEGLETAGFFLG